MKYKIGIGYDIHRLAEGRKLYIGGVEIPYIKGLLGHSDADVLIHAICDAMLGAAGQNDIGELFSDTDPEYENVSSVKLLTQAYSLILEKKYKINNIDAVLIAEEPPISPFKGKIRQSLASILGVDEDMINLKAKTNEKMDDIGRKEAIACYAVVMLETEG